MNTAFADVIEDVKKLSTSEKEELKSLLENYLVEERRNEIFENFQSSKQQSADGKLKFSSDSDELEAMLND